MAGELPAPEYDMAVPEAAGLIYVLGILEANGLLQGESVRRVAAQAVARTFTELSKTQFEGHELLRDAMDLLDERTIETAQGIIARSEEALKGNTETQRNRYQGILGYEASVPVN